MPIPQLDQNVYVEFLKMHESGKVVLDVKIGMSRFSNVDTERLTHNLYFM